MRPTTIPRGVKLPWVALSLRPAGQSDIQASIIVIGMVVAFAFRRSDLAALYLFCTVAIAAVNWRVFNRLDRRQGTAAIVAAIAPLFVLPFSMLSSPTAGLHYMVELASIGMAIVLSRNLEVYRRSSQVTLLFAQLAVLAFLAHSGLEGFPLENIIPESSSNGVTSYLIVLQANYCLVNFSARRRASLLTASITFFICWVGWGRGSMIAAIALLLVNLAVTITQGRNSLWKYGKIGGAIVLVVCGYFFYWDSVMRALEEGTKIGNGLYDPTRMTMISDYVGKLDPFTLWAGAPYEGTAIADEFSGNPHNSFIRAHHFFGLPYLLLILLLPIYLAWGRQDAGVKLFAAAMGLIVGFRAFTEPILFPTLLDFFYFASCFALARSRCVTSNRLAQT